MSIKSFTLNTGRRSQHRNYSKTTITKMMSENENAYMRNIIKEIMRECIPKKVIVNENFVTYYTKILLLDPNWGISDDIISQRVNVQNFVKHVINELSDQNNKEKMISLKMQFFFTCTLNNSYLVIVKNRKEVLSRLAPLKHKILRATSVTEKVGLDRLYREIVYYITLASGLGDPTKYKVYEEALVALKSILQNDELSELTNESKSVKEENLISFTKVVAGIRLFNKDCEKGGEGIEDLPGLLNKATEVVKDTLQNALVTVMDKVNTLTTIVDKFYIIRKIKQYSYTMVLDIPFQVRKRGFNMSETKELLILFRQYELLLRKMIEQLDLLSERTEVIFQDTQKSLKKIHETVYMKIAIPVDVIFPLFEELSDIWTTLQDQVILLSKYNEVIANLELYSKQVNYDKLIYEEIIGEGNSYSTDAERLERTASCRIQSNNPEVEILSIKQFQNIDKVRLQYLGFCCWKLVECNGALIPGNPSMGIAKYKRMNFVFSTPEACVCFSEKPREYSLRYCRLDMRIPKGRQSYQLYNFWTSGLSLNSSYVFQVLELARRKPQLINFFQIEEQMKIVRDIGKLAEKPTESIKINAEKEIQTEDHLVIEGPQKNATYRWNIWDLKREALLMANISKCQTSSTQTEQSFFRHPMRTQTNFPREKEQQTKKDNYTNVPTPSTFIYGLRGRKDDKQFKIDLTQWDS